MQSLHDKSMVSRPVMVHMECQLRCCTTMQRPSAMRMFWPLGIDCQFTCSFHTMPASPSHIIQYQICSIDVSSNIQSFYLRRPKLLSRELGAMAQFGYSPSYAATQPVVLPKPVIITLEQLASATAWRAGGCCLARRNCLNSPLIASCLVASRDIPYAATQSSDANRDVTAPYLVYAIIADDTIAHHCMCECTLFTGCTFCGACAADERKGLKADVERDVQNIEFHSRDFMEQMYELGFSQETVKNIIQICHIGGWRAANERAGYKNDVKKDQKQAGRLAT